MIGIGSEEMVELTKTKLTKLGILDNAKMAKIPNADLSGCTLYNHDFTGANLMGVDFTECILMECIFDRSILVKSKFNKSLIDDCSFKKVKGNGVSFAGVSFHTNCDFSHSDLSSLFADREVIVAETTFESAQALTYNVNFSNCNMRGINIDDTLLVGINLSGAKIGGEDPSGKNGMGLFILNANLFRANLQHTNMRGITMGHCRLELADLSGSDLSGLSLGTMTLWGTNFSHCNLSGLAVSGDVILAGAIMHFCNLADADLSQAISLETAKLNGSTYNKNTQWPSGFDPSKYKLKLK